MRSILSRAAVLAAATLVVLPTAASAAVGDYVVEASTTAVRLSAFENQVGSPVLELIGTDAFGSSVPLSEASVDAITVLGEDLGTVRSASSDRERVRDPESGDGCVVPVSATGLTLDAMCATARARAGNPGDTGNQDAVAGTQLADVVVDGSLLSTVLTGELDALLTDLTDELGDGAVAEAINAFTEECDVFLADPPEPLDEAPETVAELLGLSPAQLDAVDEEISDLSGSDPCTAIIALSTQELTQDVVDVQPLADALDGVDLVQISIDGARSMIAGTDTTMSADAEQVFVTITGPSLAFLDDAIIAIVQGMYDGFVAEIETIAGQEVPEDFDITDELAAALEQVPLFGITDPLITAVVSGGTATGELDLGDGAATGGGDEPFVTVAIAAGVVELLGGDPESASQTLEAGESQTIAADTPAESTISVGALTVDDAATSEDRRLTGTRATSSATEVTLLSGVEGGVVLTLAESSAGVFGVAATVHARDPDAGPLPNTGGGAALAAMLALGAAVALRRRTS